MRLVARTGTPSGALATRTSASKRPTVSTNRAAGRACRPIALRTSSTVRASAAGSSASAGGASLTSEEAPSCELFIASAPRASAATSSSDAPPRAAAAAATVPSTSGASLSTTGPARLAEQLDRELGAHQRAAEIHQDEDAVGGHRPLDRRSHALGVGSEDARLVSPAGRLERERRRRPISRASATTPSASASLWDTTTIPTMLRPQSP